MLISVGVPFGAGFGCVTPKAHSPVANPATVLGVACASPYCTTGELPEHRRLPAIGFVRISDESGSANVLFAKVRLPPIVLRRAPVQHDWSPVIRRLPAMVLSS